MLLNPLVFFLILLGAFLLKQAGFFHEGDHRLVSKIVLNLTMPAAIVHAFIGFSDSLWLFLSVVLVGLFFTLLPYFAVFFITRNTPRAPRVFYLLNITGYNIGCFGMPFIQIFWGAQGAAVACMLDIGNSVMVTGGTYALTSTLLPAQGERVRAIDILKKFVTSIPFDVYTLVLILLAAGIQIPEVVGTLTAPLAEANSFLAMLMLGLMIQLPKTKAYRTAVMRLVAVRLCFSIVFSLLVFFLTPFPLYVRQVLAVLVFAPSSVIATVFTETCGGDPALAGFSNSVTVVLGLAIMSCLSVLLPLA